MILVIDFTQWEDYLNQLTSASQQVPRFTRCLKLQLRAVTQLFIQGNSLRVLKLSLKSSDQDQSLERVTPVLEHLRLLRWVKLEKVEFDKGFLPVIGELLEWARGLREEIKGNKPFVID